MGWAKYFSCLGIHLQGSKYWYEDLKMASLNIILPFCRLDIKMLRRSRYVAIKMAFLGYNTLDG